MSRSVHVAAVRFGLGLRLGEAPPDDALGWLESQLGPEAPLPPGHSAAEGLRARSEDLAERERNAGDLEGQGRVVPLVRAETLAWARRRLTAEQPFRERLVDFWMNHFTASRRAGLVNPVIGGFEREAIRPHVTGRFADMLVAVVRHPAMLLYLDNAGSVGPGSPFGLRSGRGLNENLAREVLELHSLSPAGGYTQGDVQELARILTGWSVALRAEPFGFQFRPQTHEPGSKQLLGQEFGPGEAGGEAALRFLGTHPATFRHLAFRLVRHFVADAPPPEAVRAVGASLRDTGGDLGAAARVLIRLPQAWEPPLGKFRAPMDYVLAACRALGLPPERAEAVLNGLGALGQPLWNAPQPNGWADTAAEWAAPEALMRRLDWAFTLAGRFGRLDPREVAEAALGPLARAETVTAASRAGSVRDAITLVFGSPEFMHR
ncbi:DUF1800 family protein [Siccirubricoccus sp. G192]|uniref:DUF1800 domain-containing protein n=1 Tax=Siccirubricoccus sp. G192 TaxID=2849651 RepID=UPI001C2CAD48|nr:DUF1800 domain-containing protein [Siccirubricoccus sp. G192]MBV1797764.1 DUF1800 domain-containing protein [Siccirubricoccus sp. G192]